LRPGTWFRWAAGTCTYSVPPACKTVTAPPLGEFMLTLKARAAKSACPDPVIVTFSAEPAELVALMVSSRRNVAVLWLVLAV
jgi:hypothetical protein